MGPLSYSLLAYDPEKNGWTKEKAQLVTARHSHSMVTDGESLYVLGGEDNDYSALSSVEKWSPGRQTFTELKVPMCYARTATQAVYRYGFVFVLGGKGRSSFKTDTDGETDTVLKWDIAKGTWTECLVCLTHPVCECSCVLVTQ